MSDTSTLISCTGKMTRAELAKLPTPPATETHIPIPHAAVVETLVETLSHRHIGVPVAASDQSSAASGQYRSRERPRAQNASSVLLRLGYSPHETQG